MPGELARGEGKSHWSTDDNHAGKISLRLIGAALHGASTSYKMFSISAGLPISGLRTNAAIAIPVFRDYDPWQMRGASNIEGRLTR